MVCGRFGKDLGRVWQGLGRVWAKFKESLGREVFGNFSLEFSSSHNREGH